MNKLQAALCRLNCFFGRHSLKHFLLSRDQKWMVEACEHCFAVTRLHKLTAREVKQLSKVRRKCKLPWPTIDLPPAQLRKSLVKIEKTPQSARMSEPEKPETPDDGKKLESKKKKRRHPRPETSLPRQIRNQDPPPLIER